MSKSLLIGSRILIQETRIMFDINTLEFIGGRHGVPYLNRDRQHYSFVGIKRNKESGNLQFWLPLGFDNFDNRDFELVKTFFFRMYKTFKLYLKRRKYPFTDEELDNQRDGLHEQSTGFTFSIEDQDDVVLYAKLNALDKILEGYDELKISSLAKKLLTAKDFDYNDIYKYLHQAVYLEDDIAFLDEMQLKKYIIRPDHPPIVQIFCFIYTELKKELEELESVNSLAIDLSDEFKETFLNLESSLFDENTFQDTILHLKDLLEESLVHTPYKDEDFWHFYEAVEAFLYGENNYDDTDDIYWGISNFYDVWEDLCQFYMLNALHPFKDRILYADSKGVFQDYMKLSPASFSLNLDAGGKPKTLRPDLVYYNLSVDGGQKSLDQIFEIEALDNEKYVRIRLKDEAFQELYFSLWKELVEGNRFSRVTAPEFWDRIRHGILNQAKRKIQRMLDSMQTSAHQIYLNVIDYKYMSEVAFHEYNEYTLNESGENKVQDDIKKQLIYEWTLQQNFPEVVNFPHSFTEISTMSEFWIPYFSDEEDDFLTQKLVDVINNKFNASQIKIVKINFQTLQKYYISI